MIRMTIDQMVQLEAREGKDGKIYASLSYLGGQLRVGSLGAIKPGVYHQVTCQCTFEKFGKGDPFVSIALVEDAKTLDQLQKKAG